MIEKIKIVLSNTQFRNILYLFLGLIGTIILLLIFNPNLEYRSFPEVKDESEVVIPVKKKQIDEILEEYRKLNTYDYTINYDEFIVKGNSVANIFYNDIKIEELNNLLPNLTPSKIYNMIKSGSFISNNDTTYIYLININGEYRKLKLNVENEEVKGFSIELDVNFSLKYGG